MRKPVTARQLMKGPVRQLTTWAPVRDAAAFLLRHGISGAPVIDEHGRWKGVFTQNDLVRYVQNRIKRSNPERSLESREEVAAGFEKLPDPFGDCRVGELMTLGLFTVYPEATLDEVVHTLTTFKVHRVFVIDEHEPGLLGVITSMDVLNWMATESHLERKKARRLAQA